MPPLSICPEHPVDQSPCIIAKCPACSSNMWVSEKKRELIAREPSKYVAICLKCAVFIHKMQGIKSADEVEFVNINKSGGIQ